MKAVVVVEPGRFEVGQVAMPAPARGEALLRVKATTVCGTDQKIFAGQFPGTKFPHIPGHEFAGEVVEFGPGVSSDIKPGARVGVEVHVACGIVPSRPDRAYTLCLALPPPHPATPP